MPDHTIEIFLIVLSAFAVLEFMLYLKRRRATHKAEAVLKKAKEEIFQLSQLSMSNPYPLLQIDGEGQILFANPAAMREYPDLFRHAPKAPLHPILEHALYMPENTERWSCEAALKSQIYLLHFFKFCGSQAGDRASKNKTAQAANSTSIIIHGYNVTRIKQAERELQSAYANAESARKSAEQAKEARGQFLANMSHELRTPMNGIIGLSDMLLQSSAAIYNDSGNSNSNSNYNPNASLSNDDRASIGAINSSAKTLLRVLNDILDFSKIEAGELALNAIEFDLVDLIKDVQALYLPLAAQKGLGFSLQLSQDEQSPALPLPLLIGDSDRIR
ncbi:MAG: sensor histidine kinase [Alphaproteobacteria bacterium]